MWASTPVDKCTWENSHTLPFKKYTFRDKIIISLVNIIFLLKKVKETEKWIEKSEKWLGKYTYDDKLDDMIRKILTFTITRIKRIPRSIFKNMYNTYVKENLQD